jgi:hypothetical integral membrane protein (TIGR02206 family)
MAASFEHFGRAHLGAIALTFATPLILCGINRSCDGLVTGIINWSLAALLVGGELFRLILLRRDGQLAFATAAPMHLCDWAAIAAMITLVYPNQWTYELCYFWAFGGTLQALVTPDLARGFPDARFINFFALHGGVIAAALYMTLCLGMRPVPMSIARVLAWSMAYLAIAMVANSMLGANFGYLRMKPTHPSLLDYLAPWPFYIVQLVLLGIVFALLYYSPFFIIDQLRPR